MKSIPAVSVVPVAEIALCPWTALTHFSQLPAVMRTCIRLIHNPHSMNIDSDTHLKSNLFSHLLNLLLLSPHSLPLHDIKREILVTISQNKS